MGQAKLRGSHADRMAAAKAAQEDETPINVPCRTCKAILNGFTLIKHSPAGAAWQKQCECGAVTTALVQSKHSNLPRTFAQTLGLAKEITGGEKKVSVSFLEKSVETVETGFIAL